MTKAELRKIYLERRLSLSEIEYGELNLSICKNFVDQIEVAGLKVLHTFLPLEKKREPDTWLIINEIIKRSPDIRISVPRINPQTNSMENFFLEGPGQLSKNSLGISEPQFGIETNPAEIELVIIPMLVCDQYGHRVGYGKGYYDKFLSTCSANCKRIGICFFAPIDKIDDATTLDIPLHYCVTPSELYYFKPTAPAD